MNDQPNLSEDAGEADFGLFIDCVVDYAIFRLTPDGNIASWNLGAQRLNGYATQEILGRHFSIFYTDEDRELGLPRQLLYTAETLGRVEHTGWQLRKNGNQFWAEVILTVVRNAKGELLGFTKVTHDLTERKESQEREHQLTLELQEANRMHSEFLANMSQEIRTPLNGIVAGRLEVKSIVFSPMEVAHDVVELLRPAAIDKNIELLLHVSSDIPEAVMGDASSLRQILLNLTGNALKFTIAGSVDVRLRYEDRGGNWIRLRFEVSDTGIGIDQAQREQLFGHFSRADVSTIRRFGGTGFGGMGFGGTGLGLIISRQLTELIGGTLDVVSEPGYGSTFWLSVPFQEASGPEIAKMEPTRRRLLSAPVLPQSKQTKGRVLIVEDNEVNQGVLVSMIETLGYQSDVVTNGQEAVTAVGITQYDAIFMDCQMPVMDGYEATRRIRALEGNRQHTPIIAATAAALPGERRRCLDAGMDDYLSKPIVSSELHEIVIRYVQNRPTLHLDAPRTDLARLFALQELLGTEFSKLLHGFLRSSYDRVAEIKAALLADDALALDRAAHMLKGTSATFAADEMADLAWGMEQQAVAGDLVGARAGFEHLAQTLARTEQLLRTELPAAFETSERVVTLSEEINTGKTDP